jgi:hypothetical protein
VQCYQAFEAYSATHIRTLGLTPPQFDIVATLGNTSGMTATELGEKTLITKGTLTAWSTVWSIAAGSSAWRTKAMAAARSSG